MKARIIFYCVVIAVLLATLAAIPSHAMERRDPLLNQEVTQASGSGHSESSPKPTPSRHHGKKPNPAHQAHPQGAQNKAAKNNDSASNKNSK